MDRVNERPNQPWCFGGILAKDRDHLLTHLKRVFPDLRGARIFVTGGTGFFGKWLLESLVAMNDVACLGIQATVLSRNPSSFLRSMPHCANRSDLRFAQGDVLDFELPKEPFTHVIHAATAASAALSAENPLLMIDTVVQGTRRVLDFAAACGVKRLLFTSSGAVYGAQPPEISHVNEECLLAPRVLEPGLCYHEAKRLAEMLCAIYAKKHGIEMKIARCFAFVGPHLPLDTHFAVGNFLRDGLAGGPICVGGDGTPLRSYLYAADLVVWLWTILANGVSLRPYNVGSARAVSIADLAYAVAQTFAPNVPEVRIAKSPDPTRPVVQYVPNVDRAQKELGLSVEIELEKALQRTVAWLRCC